jgi:hypothetical protein
MTKGRKSTINSIFISLWCHKADWMPSFENSQNFRLLHPALTFRMRTYAIGASSGSSRAHTRRLVHARGSGPSGPLLARNDEDTILKESVGHIDGDDNNALVFLFKKHPCAVW